ncbi:MAG: ATPase, T2SS/T4P/T4SS family [Candidatus Micrarchaeota archaeon]
MLGWKITEGGEYRVPLPRLGEEEEELVSAVEGHFRNEARSKDFSSRGEVLNSIKSIVLRTAQSEGIFLDRDQVSYLPEVCFLHIYGFAFIEKLLEDPSIEEISVVGTSQPAYVYVRREGWKRTNAQFTSLDALTDVINKMGKNIGRRITLQRPKLNAILPDGSRLHASLPPLSAGELTIRRFTENPFSPQELVESGAFPARAVALLSLLMQADMSLIISGNTASGKTTTLNSVFSFVPEDERIVITEESPEINIPHAHKARLIANEEMGVSLRELVYDTLRMRPDRLIVGEVRNAEEVSALFDALLGGQARGCYATFHANSAEETLRRLKFFGVSEADFGSMDAIVVQRRMLHYDPKKRKNAEVRRMVEFCSGPSCRPVVSYDAGSDSWKDKGAEEFLSSLSTSLGLSVKELSHELKERESFLKKKRGFRDFFEEYQRKFYGK